MKLTYFKGSVPNFGDALNPYLWNRLLPAGFLDEDESELFLGIGSIIWDYLSKDSRKFVMGSGYGGYTGLPDLHDGSWDVVFVRGPRTAALFDLPPEKAICDSAVLLRALQLPPAAAGIGVAFMPHFESLERGVWRDACDMAGVYLIDPRDDVEKVIREIKGARMLITEAMHGAIVADALRTPWLAVRPIHTQHHMKWLDWSEALGLSLSQHKLRPSNLMELYVAATFGKRYYGWRAAFFANSTLAWPANRILTHMAAQRLQKLARLEPQLSSDKKIGEVTERAMDAFDNFVGSRAIKSAKRGVF